MTVPRALDVERLADPPLRGRALGKEALDGLVALDGPEEPDGAVECDGTEAPDRTEKVAGTTPVRTNLSDGTLDESRTLDGRDADGR